MYMYIIDKQMKYGKTETVKQRFYVFILIDLIKYSI